MTTSVKISAHVSSEKEVQVNITDEGKEVKSFTLQDGETAEESVYDGLEISVKEQPKQAPPE